MKTLLLAASSRPFVQSLVTSSRNLIGALGDWPRNRRDTRALQALDDRMLADIGIWRGEIPALVRRHQHR